jgi:hypothetical protein
MQHHFQPLLLGIDEAAALLSFAPATLTSWAYRRKPKPAGFPEPIRVAGGAGRRATIRYRVADLIAWVDGLAGGGTQTSDGHQAAPTNATSARSRGRPRQSLSAGKAI